MYNITQATLNSAKRNGKLSPMLAGNLAIDLGEDARYWMSIAALETERDSTLRERLRKTLIGGNP
jgi:bacterioferritin (cytochrome b1)